MTENDSLGPLIRGGFLVEYPIPRKKNPHPKKILFAKIPRFSKILDPRDKYPQIIKNPPSPGFFGDFTWGFFGLKILKSPYPGLGIFNRGFLGIPNPRSSSPGLRIPRDFLI